MVGADHYKMKLSAEAEENIHMFIDPKETSEVVKNSTEASKNVAEIVQMILQPRGIDAAILEGHKKIIEDVTTSDQYSLAEKEFFLANYKKQIKQYRNCKSIAEMATENILPDRKTDAVDADWFAFFFDKAQLISDESMQRIWASILAEELNTPNSISRSFIHMLSIIDKKSADDFCNLCRFCWFDMEHDKIHPFIYITHAHEAYKDSRITWAVLKNLEYLGLINCDGDPGYILTGPRRFRTGNVIVHVEGSEQNQGCINIGNVVLTYNGRKLFDMVDQNYKGYRNDIYSFIANELHNFGCKVTAKSVVRGRYHKE